MNRQMTLLIALLAVVAVWPIGTAFAQTLVHERGNIMSIDTAGQTIELKDLQNRVVTRRFRSDATVKFSDGPAFFPNPSVKDLRPPMYVHYMMNTSEVIESFDVRELGFDPASADTSFGPLKQPGVPRIIAGRVTAYDPGVRQVAIAYAGTIEAFQLTAGSDTPLSAGQRVQLRTEWSGQQELVTEIRILDQGSTSEDAKGSRFPGKVLRVTEQDVLMSVAGTEQLYRCTDLPLLKKLPIGKTVLFDWERRQGQLYIVAVH